MYRNRRFSPDLLRGARRAAGYSQAELARLVGVSLVTMKAWESGQRAPQTGDPAAGGGCARAGVRRSGGCRRGRRPCGPREPGIRVAATPGPERNLTRL